MPVLGYFATLYVAALHQTDSELRDDFLPRQIAHQGHML
jgi:hypothetical protein